MSDFKPYIETLLFRGTDELLGWFFQRPTVFVIGDAETQREEHCNIVRFAYDSADNLIRCQIEIDSKEKELLLQIAMESGLISKLESSSLDYIASCWN